LATREELHLRVDALSDAQVARARIVIVDAIERRRRSNRSSPALGWRIANTAVFGVL
jgi:hypothetical protein